jgi:hypothetical protein
MKPNFEEMSRKELRAYVLEHREDMEALHILFSRRSPDSEAILFHPPQSEKEQQQQFELFKHIIDEKERKKDN